MSKPLDFFVVPKYYTKNISVMDVEDSLVVPWAGNAQWNLGRVLRDRASVRRRSSGRTTIKMAKANNIATFSGEGLVVVLEQRSKSAKQSCTN
ncbi:MAG TPA: hypothetical protein VOA41_04660 [Candidatus Dormibacteraeota bacterium]|nr:hypothetical protein [Candidatus Dormibacteraeota bacterium]